MMTSYSHTAYGTIEDKMMTIKSVRWYFLKKVNQKLPA